jgi:LytS/YehU family sensor histidine kinase
VDVILGFVVGLGVAASGVAAIRLLRMPKRVLSPEAHAMQAALHAGAAPHLLELTQAAAIALADEGHVLAFVGEGHRFHAAGDDTATLAAGGQSDRVHVDPRLDCGQPGCPLRGAVVVPLTLQGRRVGSLCAFYTSPGRIRPEDMRVVQEAASLIGAQIALAALETQGEQLARAEL